MHIQQKETGLKGSFFIEGEKEILAEMTYTLLPHDILRIDHTEVDEVLKGKNIGYQLVANAAEYAREKHYKIVPLCPFAKSVLERKRAEFADVLF